MTMDMASSQGRHRWAINSFVSLVDARRKGRDMAREMGFAAVESALIATAVSELGRHMLRRQTEGEIELRVLHQDGREGIALQAHDRGPVVLDIEQAVRKGRLGSGLQGVTRLMDAVNMVSEADRGTTITLTKWRDL